MQKAVVVSQQGPDATVNIVDITIPEPGIDDVLIRLSHSGVCHGDVSLIYGDWQNIGLHFQETMVHGHEGVGVITEVGTNVKNFQPGDRVGIKWIHSTCGFCKYCLSGNDHYCPKQQHFGRHHPGSFQQYVVSPARYTSPIPPEVSDVEAGPMLCGGVTILLRIGIPNQTSKLSPGQWVVIFGAGGGLGHLGVQFAKAMGMRVVGIDGGQDKKALCLSLGVDVFVDFLDVKDVVRAVSDLTDSGVAGVIVTAASRSAYEQGARMLGIGGTLVCVGLPHEPFDIPVQPFQFIQTGCVVTGTNAGSLQDVQEALAFAARKQVRVEVQCFPMEQAEAVFQNVKANRYKGRAVLKLE
ncbi:uncharacterized protein N7458_000972 [Penicillium daleae]|uniref:Enoyl reductase (ER) domain-containing protein n=1 Tax=Penicillium daleae TaxID=63821 RepID=A0AAD6CH48_9EURO|nr:uncharacterized protein N7458_000972 [Penicillium daleae]KAJ5465286.1 hypothetical protein N7458_000972 [Penicillium daleae]